MNYLDNCDKLKCNENWKIEYMKVKFFNQNQPYNSNTYWNSENKANKIKRDNICKLYKYCSFDKDRYSLTNLFKSQVYMKNTNKFNDPFDSVYSITINQKSILNGAIKTLKGEDMSEFDKNELRITLDQMTSKTVSNYIDSFRLKSWATCFSEVYNSILMWSHYSDCHRGFCIEYDLSQLNEGWFRSLSPVLYVDKMYNLSEHTFNNLGLELCTLLKSSEWRYEKEWRLEICNLKGTLQELYVPKPTAIYLGACIEMDNVDIELLDFAKQNGIDVYKMKPSLINYKLEHYKIEL